MRKACPRAGTERRPGLLRPERKSLPDISGLGRKGARHSSAPAGRKPAWQARGAGKVRRGQAPGRHLRTQARGRLPERRLPWSSCHPSRPATPASASRPQPDRRTGRRQRRRSRARNPAARSRKKRPSRNSRILLRRAAFLQARAFLPKILPAAGAAASRRRIPRGARSSGLPRRPCTAWRWREGAGLPLEGEGDGAAFVPGVPGAGKVPGGGAGLRRRRCGLPLALEAGAVGEHEAVALDAVGECKGLAVDEAQAAHVVRRFPCAVRLLALVEERAGAAWRLRQAGPGGRASEDGTPP